MLLYRCLHQHAASYAKVGAIYRAARGRGYPYWILTDIATLGVIKVKDDPASNKHLQQLTELESLVYLTEIARPGIPDDEEDE
jgi:hypothetical protein